MVAVRLQKCLRDLEELELRKLDDQVDMRYKKEECQVIVKFTPDQLGRWLCH